MVVQAAMDSDVYFWWFVGTVNENMGDVISYLYLHFYSTHCTGDSKPWALEHHFMAVVRSHASLLPPQDSQGQSRMWGRGSRAEHMNNGMFTFLLCCPNMLFKYKLEKERERKRADREGGRQSAEKGWGKRRSEGEGE